MEAKDIYESSTALEAEQIEKQFNNIQQIAKDFIDAQEDVNKQTVNFTTQLKEQIQKWHKRKNQLTKNKSSEEIINNEYESYLNKRTTIKTKHDFNKLKSIILEAQKKAIKFHQEINHILGQEVVTAYVYVDEKGDILAPTVYKITDISDFLRVDISKTGDLIVRYRNSKEWLDNIDNAMNMFTENEKNELLDYTYNEICNRYKTHKVKRGLACILWIDPYTGTWTENGYLVSTLGSINQTYVGWLLGHEIFKCRNIPEDNIEKFMSSIGDVTNLSGALYGDFTVGNLQIAVKSLGASVMGNQQLLEMAKKIKLKTTFSEIFEYLKSTKEQHKKEEERINLSFKEAEEKIVKKAIAKYELDNIESIKSNYKIFI